MAAKSAFQTSRSLLQPLKSFSNQQTSIPNTPRHQLIQPIHETGSQLTGTNFLNLQIKSPNKMFFTNNRNPMPLMTSQGFGNSESIVSTENDLIYDRVIFDYFLHFRFNVF